MAKKKQKTLKGDATNGMSLRFGKALKAIRLKNRLTQKQIANSIPEDLGVNQSYLSRLENGDLFPGKSRMSAICEALGCSIAEAWSLAESLDIPENALNQGCEHQDQLLACLSNDKLGLDFEDVSAAQDYVESRMQQLSDALDRLHVGLVTYGQVDRRDIDILKTVAREIVLPAKAAQCIVDLLSNLIDRSPEVAVVPAEQW